MRVFLFHLPLIGSLLIAVWMPLGAVLALVQLCPWIGWAISRFARR